MKVITMSFPIARKVVIEILRPILYVLHCSLYQAFLIGRMNMMF
jgi:hypothetical protein